MGFLDRMSGEVAGLCVFLGLVNHLMRFNG